MKYIDRYILSFCLLSLSFLPACKKKEQSASDLKLATVAQTNGSAGRQYRIVYDNINNVDSIVWVGVGTSSGTSGFTKFTYVGTSYTMRNVSGVETMVYADAGGKILKVLQPDTLIMHYKNNLLEALDHKNKITVPPYYAITTEYYTWKDNDLTFAGPSGGTGVGYYYDNGRGGQAGDPMRVENFLLYGRSYIKTSHLPLGATRNADTIARYFYQFDGEGRITALSSVSYAGTATDTVVFRYGYK